jgi:hypothetical protein
MSTSAPSSILAIPMTCHHWLLGLIEVSIEESKLQQKDMSSPKISSTTMIFFHKKTEVV